MNNLVIYHGQCIDGFAAAWVANVAFRTQPGETTYYAASYGSTPPWKDIGKAQKVWILDFSYSRTEIKTIEKMVPIQILDHHKTARAALEGLSYATFDTERSGAGLTWDTFYPHVARPWCIDYVEDRDLWRHALPDSQTLHAYIRLVDFTFEAWDKLRVLPKEEALRLGEGSRASLMRYVSDVLASGVRRVDFELPDGTQYRNLPTINVPYHGCSEVGSRLAKDNAFCILWHMGHNGMYRYSLRSDKTGSNVDVSAIALQYGGGGHHNAAGFTADRLLF